MIKFFRAFKTAFQYIFRNFGLSFASIIVTTLSFFIVSVVGLAFFASFKLVEYVDSKPALTVYLRGDLDEAGNKKFNDLIASSGLSNRVVINDIEFSKEELRKSDPELAEVVTPENQTALPLFAFIYSDSQDNLSKMIELLRNNNDFMSNIVDRRNITNENWYKFNKDQAEVIRDTNKLLQTSGIAITAFLFVISSILIFITIRLTIHYHRKELEIMDLVGAEGWFIKLPFIIDGMIYGILGGLFSVGILFAIKNFILQKSQGIVPKLISFFSDVQWPALTPMLILKSVVLICSIGAIVGAISSFFAIIKYVKK